MNPTSKHAHFLNACERGHTEIVRRYLNLPKYQGIHPAMQDNLPLRIACANGHDDIVCLLLAHKTVDPTARHSEALRLASARNQTFLIRIFLIDGRADPSANNNECLRNARKHKNRAILELLEADSRVQACMGEEDPC